MPSTPSTAAVLPLSMDDVTPEFPWLGLRSFTYKTRGYFFGRNAELQDRLYS